MPTYDGIGDTITHKLEIEGDMFLQDIEGGSLSTQVPLEIFSDFTSSNDESVNSRMLRLRVNNLNAIQDDNSNIYVADMGIKGVNGEDYFFITAPQNTSNVGDQNTFVISKTSNVGIGTTDPGHYRLLVNSSSTKHFGVPGNDTPTTGDTLVYNEDGEWVYHFVEGTLPPGTNQNEILTWNGTNWVPNSSIITTNSNTSIGIGTHEPGANLHVWGSVTATTDVDISGKFQGGKIRVGSLLSAVPTNPNVTVPGDLTVSGTLTSDEWIHTSNLDITGNINVDHDVLIDGTYQGTGMRLDGTLQNLRGAIPDLSVAGSITATGDIKTDQTFRGTDASITGTITTSNITHNSELTVTSNLLMGPGTTLTTSNIVGSSFLTVTANTNVVAELTESKKLIKFPRVDMTAATTSGYTASVSSELTGDWTGWKAFNGVIGDEGWHDVGSTYSSSDGYYTGGNSLGGYSGEWIKLQLPDSIKLTQIRIAPRTSQIDRAPKDAICLGSTDGSNWYILTSWTDAAYNKNRFNNFYVNTDNYYSYIAIVTTRIGLDTTVNISEIEYYGYLENDDGDGTDVLFKTVPNTPKTDFLDLYYDAKDYSSMPATITNKNGGGSSGTPYNVTFNSTEPKSFEFNGTSSYINSTLTNPAGDWVHSINLWLKVNASSISSRVDPFQIGNVAGTSQYSALDVYADNLSWYFYSNDVIINYKWVPYTWFHVGLVHYGGGRRDIYINGVLHTSGQGTGAALSLAANAQCTLGRDQTRSGYSPAYFPGSIANFRVYDHALSADEVMELYGYQKAYFSVSPDVVTYKAGKVGIGTSEPRAVLDVVGDMNVTDKFVSTGRVGIGTTNPSFNLQINGTNPTIGQYIYSNSIHDAEVRNNVYFGRWDGPDLVEFTGMRANVNSYTNAGYGDCGNQATIDFYTWGCNYSGSRIVFTIRGSGQALTQGAVVTSDDRVKINEERITNATETLMKLDPQTYDKTVDINSDNVIGREAGLIIQDVWYDAPELRYLVLLADDATPSEEKPQRSDDIQEDPDYSDWGSKSGHFNYFGLIPYLIKSNQEQQALIEDLRARIEVLENSS